MGEEGVQPTSGQVCIDRIGPIVRFDTSTEPPTEIVRPEYHTNLRLALELTEEQVSALAPYVVVPSGDPHRVWADDPNALTQEAATLRDEAYIESLLVSVPASGIAFEEGVWYEGK
jgi:hypothetical protein